MMYESVKSVQETNNRQRVNRKWRLRTKLFAALFLLLPLGAAANERFVDYAAEDAAYRTIRSLTNSEVDAGQIAFVGLFGEEQDLASVFRAGVISTPGQFRFYTRDEDEWDTLVDEIDFANRRSDVMDSETIQEFGRIQGVEALLYGEIREARVVDDDQANVRLAMTLADVETGEILWSSNIEGTYSITTEPSPLAENVRRAAIATAQNAADRLHEWSNDRDDAVQVFFLPLEGENGDRITDIMVGELVGTGGDRLRFFSPPSESETRRMLDRLAEDLYGPGAASEAHRQRITEQLGQIAADKSDGDRTVPVNAVLMGQVTGVNESEELQGTATRVSVNLQMINPLDHRNLWSSNVEGAYVGDAAENILTRLRIYLTDNIAMVAAVAVGALVILFLLGKMLKAVTRPR